MKDSKIIDLIFDQFIIIKNKGWKIASLRDKNYPLLKEKYIKKINNFLFKTFNLKFNSNYFIKSGLSGNIKIYKIISDKNYLVIEMDFTKDLNSELFTDFMVRIKEDVIKDDDNLEKIVTLGKISKILLTKKSIILEKYNKFLTNFINQKNKIANQIKKNEAIGRKSKNKTQLYRLQYIKNNIFSKKGLSVTIPYFKSDILYPDKLENITYIKCNYLKNEKIEVILESKDSNSNYTYNISKKLFKELINTEILDIGYFNDINPILTKRFAKYVDENDEYLKNKY
tara:strand:- start:296 stop:1147 length:852 start_codon:yes stop_codon:yes gene_type:complete